ncbi:unnamed protein product [Ambrosiozyma monospora]|uniref:Unnamed protein product n=1 Tax=Ambrosiozyma monospora TaxID=43982 RepID=A0ACB5SYU9_AMBMO|nr:unnamed protein product [Ambrosiozyma monospora]
MSAHCLLGHLNPKALLESINHGTIIASEDDKKSLYKTMNHEGCTECYTAKARRANAVEGSKDPYEKPIPFHKVSSDVCMVTAKNDPGVKGYFVTFRDNFTTTAKTCKRHRVHLQPIANGCKQPDCKVFFYTPLFIWTTQTHCSAYKSWEN